MERKGDWLQTFSGVQFWPIDPQIEDIRLVDIAHGLAYTCRYNGHCNIFYSVAEHSIIISEQIPNEKPEEQLFALLHDASEAYISDIPRPLKPYLDGYSRIERNIENTIDKFFGLTDVSKVETKRLDKAILADEKEQVMGIAPADWFLENPPLGITISGWPPEPAYRRFLQRYYDIIRRFKI